MEQIGREVALLIRVLEVNEDHNSASVSFLVVEVFRGFSQPLNGGIVPLLSHDRFLPNPQVTCHLISM
jgi:hypothetical protein